MGNERDNRDDDRGADGWRQPRQDYDRSAGSRDYGDPRAQGYGNEAARRETRDDYTRTTGAWRGRSRDDGRQHDRPDDDRGFLDRAGDEVRSWFGDEDAERRRRSDERDAERDGRERPGNQRPDYMRAGAWGDDRPTSDRLARRADVDQRHSATDPHYRSWRDRQMEQYDRDYDDYRREHQAKFDTEFHGWRTNRQTQRDSLSRVQEHQEVVGSDGKHVGTVDKMRGDTIVLTKQDVDAGGRHHAIPLSWIQSIDNDKVTISKTADEAQAHWRDAERNPALWNDSRHDARATQAVMPGRAGATIPAADNR